jgi:hypothetical protein
MVKRTHDPLPNFDAREVAFNAEAVRSYLFSAGQHVLEGMTEQKVNNGAAAVLTGSVEFAAQLWMQVALQSGVPVKKARETAEKEFRGFLRKHSQPQQQQTALES